MKQQASTHYTWTVREIIPETPRVYSLILEAQGERPSFISGQYLTVRLSGFEPAEGKSYSISSAADEPLVRLTIKEIGSFSKALTACTPGDTLTTSAPYGFFYPEETDTRDIVFVAGGIGITPCISIMKTLTKNHYPKNISLVYSNRTLEDCIFKDTLDTLKNTFPNVSITYHFTREDSHLPGYNTGRITGESICTQHAKAHESDFFVCGSIDFTKGLWKELRDAGIESAQIYTEGYF